MPRACVSHMPCVYMKLIPFSFRSHLWNNRSLFFSSPCAALIKIQDVWLHGLFVWGLVLVWCIVFGTCHLLYIWDIATHYKTRDLRREEKRVNANLAFLSFIAPLCTNRTNLFFCSSPFPSNLIHFIFSFRCDDNACIPLFHILWYLSKLCVQNSEWVGEREEQNGEQKFSVKEWVKLLSVFSEIHGFQVWTRL